MFVVERVHATGDADGSLLAWGASIGTRTTNGEWWRLLTATFLHATFMHLVINVAVIPIVGPVLGGYLGLPAVPCASAQAGRHRELDDHRCVSDCRQRRRIGRGDRTLRAAARVRRLADHPEEARSGSASRTGSDDLGIGVRARRRPTAGSRDRGDDRRRHAN